MYNVADHVFAQSDGSSSCVRPKEKSDTLVPNSALYISANCSPSGLPIPLNSTDLVHSVSERNFLQSARSPWLFQLTDIDEDACGEENTSMTELMKSWGAVVHGSTGTTVKPCAVPVGICCSLLDATEETDAASPSVRVYCTTPGCNYGGPVHRGCLQHWNSCCEIRCRMLATLCRPGHIAGEPIPDSRRVLDELASLYRCPYCGQCSICRTKTNAQGTTVMDLSDSYVNIASAMKLTSELANQPVGHKVNHPDPSFLIENRPNLPGEETIIRQLENDLVNANSSLECTYDAGSTATLKQLGKRSSCSAVSMAQQIPSPWTQPLSQPIQLTRRLSLFPAGSSSGSFSSGGSSGFGSLSLESSRRGSQNTNQSEGNDSMMRNEDAFWPISPDSAQSKPAPYCPDMKSPWMSYSKNDSLFTFPSHSPLKSDSPMLNPLSSLDINCDSPDGRQHHSVPVRHSLPNQVQDDVTRSNVDTTLGTKSSGSFGRRHNSESSAGRTSSFWPTERCKTSSTCPEDEDCRKVVNRKGNIFQPRSDFSIFEQKLPPSKRNAYFIQMDDDSCTGNEDTRAFLLAQLTNHRMSEVSCLICHRSLVVYDHFPVIDGTFFISPVCHRSTNVTGLRITWYTNGIAPASQSSSLSGSNTDPDKLLTNEHSQRLLASGKPVVPPPGCLGPRQQISMGHLPDATVASSGSFPKHHHHAARQDRYLHALCMECMHHTDPSKESTVDEVTKIICRSCGRPWTGVSLLVGGLYTYDVFASMPCCPARLTCKTCGQRLDGHRDTRSSQGSCYADDPGQDAYHWTAPSQNSESTPLKTQMKTSSSFLLPFYSQYSQLITCSFCSKIDHHFVKPFDQYYETVRSSTGVYSELQGS